MSKKLFNIYLGVPKLTKMLFPIIFLEHMVTAFCFNVSVYFKKMGAFNYELIGQFISTYYFGCLFGALIGGMLTLRFRTTHISGVGMMLVGGCLYCLFGSLNPYVIQTFLFLIGLMGTVVVISNIASLIRSVTEEHVKLKVISIELILFNLAFSLVSFILLDAGAQKIAQIMVYFPFLIIAAGLLALTVYKDPIFAPLPQKQRDKQSFLPKQKQAFFILISMVFCFGLIFSMVKVVYAPALIERFGSNALSATVALINPWVIFLFQPLIVDRIKSSNSTWFLGVGGLIVGLNYFAFGMVSSFSLTALFLVLLTFGEMMFSPLSKHLNVQLYGPGKEGVASGIWRAVFLGSGIIGPKVSGYVAEHYGASVVWECCAVLGLFCLLFSFFLKRERQYPLVSEGA